MSVTILDKPIINRVELKVKKSDILVIIPAYNEEETIARVVDNLVENYPQYDYVVINDGSKDKTAEICRARGFRLLDLPVNVGLAGAVQTGMLYACAHGYDCVIQMDGDGQHSPDYIAAMLRCIKENDLDLVIGSRFATQKKPKGMRMLGSRLLQLAMRITTGETVTDPTSGMRMYGKRLTALLADSLDLGPEPDTVAYLIRAGFRFKEVQVQMSERTAGESYLSASRAVKYMIHMFVSILLFQWFRQKPKFRGENRV